MTHEARKAGLGLEEKATEQLITKAHPDSPWGIITGPSIDCGRKTDFIAICPSGQERPVQVSLEPKSRRANDTLRKRDITPVYGRILALYKLHSTICDGCPMNEGCEKRYR